MYPAKTSRPISTTDNAPHALPRVAVTRTRNASSIPLGHPLVKIFPSQPVFPEAIADPEGKLAEEIDPHEDTADFPREWDRFRRASDLSDFRVVKWTPGDIWEVKDRGRPMGYFGLAPFMGPVLGPTIAAYMGMGTGQWQSIFWFLFAFSAVCSFGVGALPETYGPILLKKRAEQLRKESG
jgi:hypothetical protein